MDPTKFCIACVSEKFHDCHGAHDCCIFTFRTKELFSFQPGLFLARYLAMALCKVLNIVNMITMVYINGVPEMDIVRV